MSIYTVSIYTVSIYTVSIYTLYALVEYEGIRHLGIISRACFTAFAAPIDFQGKSLNYIL